MDQALPITYERPSSPVRTRFSAFVIGALFATLLLIVFLDDTLGHITSNFPGLTVWFTFVFVACLALFAALISHQKEGQFWVSPASITLLYYAFKFGWGALVVFYWADLPWTEFPGVQRMFSELGADRNLPFACKMILLGAVGLYCGVWMPSRPILNLLPKVSWTVDHSRFRESVVLYTPLALIFFVLIGQFLPATFVFSVLLLGWILWVIIVIAAYWMVSARSRDERIRWVVFLAFIYVASFPLGLMTGMSGGFLYPAALILMGYVVSRGQPPWKVLIAVLPFLIWVILPFLAIYKSLPETAGIESRLTATAEQYGGLNSTGKIELALERSIGRMAGAVLPSVYAKYYPDVYSFELGRTFLLEAQGLVPRFLWPDKPNLSRELNKYSVAVGILPNPDETSVVFDAVTEYYVNFGLLGVFFLSVIHGYALRVLFDWLIKIMPFFMGAAVFIVLFSANPDFFGIFQMLFNWLKIVPVWLAILYVMSHKA